MKNKELLTILAIFLFASCNTELRAKRGALKPTSLAQRHEYLKELALCSCLQYGFNSDDSLKRDISSGILAELSDYGGNPTVFAAIDSSAKKALLKIEPAQVADYDGRKPIMLGCFNYYMSKKLDSLVKSFDKPHRKKQ